MILPENVPQVVQLERTTRELCQKRSGVKTAQMVKPLRELEQPAQVQNASHKQKQQEHVLLDLNVVPIIVGVDIVAIQKDHQPGVRLATLLAMVIVEHVPPTIIVTVTHVSLVHQVKQVFQGLLLHHRAVLRRKVMVISVRLTVIALQTFAVDRIVVEQKENPLDAQFVIQMVVVAHVVQTTTSVLINVTSAVVARQVLQDLLLHHRAVL